MKGREQTTAKMFQLLPQGFLQRLKKTIKKPQNTDFKVPFGRGFNYEVT
jgi:hypothetical protein